LLVIIASTADQTSDLRLPTGLRSEVWSWRAEDADQSLISKLVPLLGLVLLVAGQKALRASGLSFPAQRQCKRICGREIRWIQFERLLVLADRGVQLAHFEEDLAQRGARAGEARI